MAAKKTVIKESEASEFTMGKAVFYLGTGLAALFGGYWLFQKSNSQSASDSLVSDPNVALATRLYNALNPGWLGRTDKNALLAIAALIKDFSAVSQAYAKLYNRNITQDLGDNLDSFWLNEFMKAVNSSKRDAELRAQGKEPTYTGYLVNTTQLTVNGRTIRAGSKVTGRGLPGPQYNDVSNYPLNYTSLAFKATGTFTVNKIKAYADDLDKSKNTYLLQVTANGKTFWQRYGAFTW